MSSPNRTVLAERDLMIFERRRAGQPIHEIAKAMGMSIAAVNSAVQRRLEKLNREALLAYPEVLRMELERLDAMQSALWPLTQVRRERVEGTDETIIVMPDIKATAEVRAIMAQRAKLLGLEQANIRLTVETEDAPAKASLHGVERAAEADAFDPEAEARMLLKLAGDTGLIPSEVAEALRLGLMGGRDIVDAEIVEMPVIPNNDVERVPLALEAGDDDGDA